MHALGVAYQLMEYMLLCISGVYLLTSPAYYAVCRCIEHEKEQGSPMLQGRTVKGGNRRTIPGAAYE